VVKRSKSTIAGGFLALPHALLNSPKFRALSSSAVKLLIDIASQFNGKNNGDLSAAWKVMKPKGWRGEGTLNRAKKELVEAGFIVQTRQGRLPNLCSLYAITWQPLNPNPKLDIGPNGFPVGAWATLPREAPKKNANANAKMIVVSASLATVLAVEEST
jgi:hypothetical protein